MRPPEWMRQAACLDADPDLFFPDPGRRDLAEQARAICRSCPVEGECYRYARTERIDYGIWGGLTPQERCGRGRPTRGAGPPAISHGTFGGYRQHIRRDEKPCDECSRANNEYNQWLRARTR